MRLANFILGRIVLEKKAKPNKDINVPTSVQLIVSSGPSRVKRLGNYNASKKILHFFILLYKKRTVNNLMAQQLKM